jgi:hypothetical protein
MLLVAASAVLVSGTVRIHDQNVVFPNKFTCFEMGLSFEIARR